MSAADIIVPLLAAPWRSRAGASLAGTPLPGLSLDVIESLAPTFPGTLNTDVEKLLAKASGLAGTPLGDLDFAARWYPEEPLPVFRPCLTLSVDRDGRRWVAEGAGATGLPGPVWCVLSRPPVAILVSPDLAAFLSTLREREEAHGVSSWLRDIGQTASAVWDHRYAIAMRCRRACQLDRAIRFWLYGLPAGAFVYDVQRPADVPGWPYGLAGERGKLFRCGRLAVFAVAD